MGSKSRPAASAATGGRAGRAVTGSVATASTATATASSTRTAAKKAAAAKAAPQKAQAGKAQAGKAPAGKAPATKQVPNKQAANKAAAKTATASGSARKKAVTVTAPAKKTAGAAKTGSAQAAKPPAAAPGRAARKTATSGTAARTGASGTTGRTARSRKTAEEVRHLAEQLAVAEDESPWTPEELKQVQADLLAEREVHLHEIDDAEAELEDLLRGPGDGAGDDQADAGAKTFEREHEIALANNARDMLRQVERALEQLVGGTYGVCENCGRPIGKLRLQAYPRATLCMPCKKNQERH